MCCQSTAGVRRKLILATVAAALGVFPGILLTGSHPVLAQQAVTEPPGLFHRFDRTYLYFAKITHVIDEPGHNMPPGSIQVYVFGNMEPVMLYGEEADAFRKALTPITKDLTPRNPTASPKPDSTNSAAGKPRRRIIAGQGSPSVGPSVPRPAAGGAENAKPEPPKTAFDEG